MRPLLRIPYTEPLPLPKIIPASANTASGAIAALVEFLSAPASTSISIPTPTSTSASTSTSTSASSSTSASHHLPHLYRGTTRSSQLPDRSNPSTTTTTTGSHASSRLLPQPIHTQNKTVLLTGAGISVASGLADYRGTKGTYTLNKTYRPIYYNEFCASHEARKRYWARSFLGWTNLERAQPNAAHSAVGRLGELGVVGSVVTQNVDSFHPLSHPSLPTLELHGYLRSLTCISCYSTYPRSSFQSQLASLNPAWSSFLAEILATGALDTENPDERRRKGLKTNPDGDVDVPGANYATFRYPACPVCLEHGAPASSNGTPAARVEVDGDGAWTPPSTSTSTSTFPSPSSSGVLKPGVVMFGESIRADVKLAAENAIDTASRILVIGSSLATYSAWRLVKRAKERGLPVGVLNIGGVRGEETFFGGLEEEGAGEEGVRVSGSAEEILPRVVRVLEGRG
ncbi:DHS-like NAD/FAD-binding domain-containing protein [Dendryphion nanum]|uniref:DHS-like NAD/FAD-binding domain-containing protein n=1 Tax=Dendryphion nanum TaxID=256645 RepID=A0A9P9DXB5_9PLEO|nr:DHS-like NAD/FAD-binding domain-containing protein [Dendryphion nanum]